MSRLIVVLTFFTVSVVTVGLFLAFEEFSFGLTNGGENARTWQIASIVVGCFLGIFSKQIFDRLTSSKRRFVYLSRDFLLAGVVSPLVIYPIYSSVGSNADLFIVFLISYQNGFFFSSTITYLESSISKRAAEG